MAMQWDGRNSFEPDGGNQQNGFVSNGFPHFVHYIFNKRSIELFK